MDATSTILIILVCTSLRSERKNNLVNLWFKSQRVKTHVQGRAQWLTPIIPALWEAEVGELRGQEFKPSLANMVKPCLYLKNTKN